MSMQALRIVACFLIVAPLLSSGLGRCAAASEASNTSSAAGEVHPSEKNENSNREIAAKSTSTTSAAAVYDTEKDQALWLDRHNWFRSDGLVWEAADMNKLQWDFTLAAEARSAIESCEKRPTETSGVHVHIESTPGVLLDASLMEGAMHSWGFNELFGVIPNLPIPETRRADNVSAVVGTGLYSHYSQIVWSTTNRLGCAYNICREGRIVACKYSPVGNSPGVGWYKYGASCAHCHASDAPKCSSKLCAASNSSSPASFSLSANESASALYLPQKVKALQLALDMYVKHPGETTSVSALSEDTGGGVACNSSSTTITQDQLSMLNLDNGLSPLAVVFGLFLGVGVILVMIVCIMHATNPKNRHHESQEQEQPALQPAPQSQSEQEDDRLQVI